MTRDEFRKLCTHQVGKPYIWGKVGPEGYDCPGLACWVLDRLQVPYRDRDSRALFSYLVERRYGTPVDTSESALGDLCFYAAGPSPRARICHVTIDWGDGRVFEAGRGDESIDTPAKAALAGPR